MIPAYDGMEALNLLEQNPVDLILLDVMMPRLNGLSALMKLREKYRIPVIILFRQRRRKVIRYRDLCLVRTIMWKSPIIRRS